MSLNLNKLNTRSVLLIAWTLLAAVPACRPTPVPIGGDRPVTTERLVATRLTDIKRTRDVSWTFSDSSLVIDNAGQPLPADIVETMKLDQTQPCIRIDAQWKLDEEFGMLQLSQIQTDYGEAMQALKLPITPAGPIRVNLAGRQYNMFAHPADGDE